VKIWNHIPKAGPGLKAEDILSLVPDPTAEIEDIKEALKIAERDGKVYRLGAYFWGEKI